MRKTGQRSARGVKPLAAVGALLALVALGAVVLFVARSSAERSSGDRDRDSRGRALTADGAVPDPQEVVLPEVEAVDATVAYLEGPASALLRFTRTTAGVTDGNQPGRATCSETLDDLMSGPRPSEMLDFAAQVPDDHVRDALTNAVGSTMLLLGKCATGRLPQHDLTDAYFSATVARRLLHKIGVA